MENPYQTPGQPGIPGTGPAKPGVLNWFKLYCGAMTLIYVACAAGAAFLFIVAPSDADMSEAEARITGALLFIVCVPFVIAFVMPFVLQPRSWVWVFGLVLICIGMTSACLIPFCVPLLIFWIKPNVQQYFGRAPKATTSPPRAPAERS